MPVTERGGSSSPDAEAIWREFHEQLHGFIERRVRSREAAEDILQDVMLRIHRTSAQVESREAVGAWIHAIARNAITDHFRRPHVRREHAAGGEVEPDSPASEAEPPDLRAELAACVTPLLKRLPDDYRQALAMTEVDGLTQAEAAEQTGLSLSGMKSRVQRARVQLHGVLVECCEVELDQRQGITDFRPRNGPCGCGGRADAI